MHAIKMMPQRINSNAIALYLKHLDHNEFMDERLVRALIRMLADEDNHLYRLLLCPVMDNWGI